MKCVLPLNHVNSKIYLALWWWLAILLIITCIGLISRVIHILVPSLRMSKINVKEKNRKKFLSNKFTKDLDCGDYFLLYKLSINMDSVNFSQLIEEISSNSEFLEEKLS